MLINNAGASVASAGILTHTNEEIRTNVETNFLGPLFLARAFAPILSARDEPVIINIHSALSWYAVAGIYSATKAALWSATNSLRLELAPKGSTWWASTSAMSTPQWLRTPTGRRRTRLISCVPYWMPSRQANTRFSPTIRPCSSRPL
ncbi:NADPH-dependent 1-acyldihydroxyacetone phosphate reductase [Arthrobacter sp. Hiyo4]|nr:NADPH-dependent 1-acyldihydroxyacetone phosphate reductase [Arthrobacter sp. Hiyo4]